MIVNKTVATNPARIASTKPQPTKADQGVQSLASSVSRFFSSYRSVVMLGLCAVSVGAAMGYWSDKISPHAYRQIVLGNVWAAIGYDAVETGLSVATPDLESRSEFEERLSWIEWVQKPKDLKGKAMIALGICSVPLTIATYISESYALPELILPRLALSVTRGCMGKLNRDLVEVNDKSILKDLEQKKWNEYGSVEEFDRKLDLAYSRLLLKDTMAATRLAKDYKIFVDSTPNVNREQGLRTRAETVILRDLKRQLLVDLRTSLQKA